MSFTLVEFLNNSFNTDEEINISISGKYSKKLFLKFIKKIRLFDYGAVNLDLSELDMSGFKELKFSDKTSFHLSHSLKSVILPKNLKRIPDCWFARCYCLEKVEIPNMETIIGNTSFFDCRELKEINLTKIIETRAFSGCEKLSVDIPEHTETIGENAFEFILNVNSDNSSFNVKNGVVLQNNKLISSYGYNVKIPDEVQIIPSRFFAGPTQKLRRIELHNKIKAVGKQAFTFQGIDTIDLPIIEFIDETAFHHCSVKNVVLGDIIKVIPKKLFCQCENLESITLPSDLERIEEGAFCRSGIKKIEFPVSLRKIGKMAFYECTNLEKVKLSKNTKIAKDAFDKSVKIEWYD